MQPSCSNTTGILTFFSGGEGVAGTCQVRTCTRYVPRRYEFGCHAVTSRVASILSARCKSQCSLTASYVGHSSTSTGTVVDWGAAQQQCNRRVWVGGEDRYDRTYGSGLVVSKAPTAVPPYLVRDRVFRKITEMKRCRSPGHLTSPCSVPSHALEYLSARSISSHHTNQS